MVAEEGEGVGGEEQKKRSISLLTDEQMGWKENEQLHGDNDRVCLHALSVPV